MREKIWQRVKNSASFVISGLKETLKMTNLTRIVNNKPTHDELYMAIELSNQTWRLAFSNGIKIRQVKIEAGETEAFNKELKKAKEHFGFLQEVEVRSCYEAGRDGFWIHRSLEKQGIKNVVVESSSINVNRRARRAKTDRLDAEKLVRQLVSYYAGTDKLDIVRIPSEEDEDKRRLHRERERLKKERTSHSNRIKSLLNLHGIKTMPSKHLKIFIETVRDWQGELLSQWQKNELLREIERLELLDSQLKELEKQMQELYKENEEPCYQQMHQLRELKGIGEIGAWVLVMEWFRWRDFKNRRELGSAAGLVGSPHDSGESQREQGISKAGNRRIRSLMVELAWMWLRYQPNSELSLWFNQRFATGKRFRRVGIVALARKLLIAIWRYLTKGEIPAGAEFKTV
jgi:transposase